MGGRVVWMKNKFGAVGVCAALLLLIPATAAKQLSTFTMQLAYQACKKLDMAHYQMNAYNMISVLMMWLPWVLVDMVSPKKEDKPRKRRSRKHESDSDDDDDDIAPEPKEKKKVAAKQVKKGSSASKKKA